ncbi:MAG: DUF2190 family protein [Desulfocapsaceae bacterium]|nr:DUF2190 family protein [Desulfocapsaceae bacterium]
MSKQSRPIFSIAIAAIGAITEYSFVTPARSQAGAGVNTLGVARFAANNGDTVTVDVMGTAIVQTGGAITDGGLVETDASGRAIAHNTGIVVGRLIPGQSSTGAGQWVEVLLMPN